MNDTRPRDPTPAAELDREWRAVVSEALRDSVRLGLIGTGELDGHIDHAVAMGAAVARALRGVPQRLLDLGSGGGLPGIVLAALWPHCHVVLLDASSRRGDVLRRAADHLDARNARVVVGRAETLAHDADLRERFAAVTARAFGPPPATAECATGFVEVGGVVVVAEPSNPDSERWPVDGLEAFGMRVRERHTAPAMVVLEKMHPADAGTPRSVGRPSKRPRW